MDRLMSPVTLYTVPGMPAASHTLNGVVVGLRQRQSSIGFLEMDQLLIRNFHRVLAPGIA